MRFAAASLLASWMLLPSACGPLEARGLAETEVDRFHELFNEASYSVIYFEADPAFRRSRSVPEFDSLMRAVRQDLGTYRQGRRTSFASLDVPEGTVATLVYASDFEQGEATEEFRYVIRAGKGYLVAYDIRSPRLRGR